MKRMQAIAIDGAAALMSGAAVSAQAHSGGIEGMTTMGVTARRGKRDSMKTMRLLMKIRSFIAAIVLSACSASFGAAALAQSPHTHDHSFGGAAEWAKVFDDPKRDSWQKPHEVIQALGLKPDATVADIGAGTGYFATRLAHMVPKGRVYAVDTEPDMVKHLTERARRDGLENLSAIAGTSNDARLPQKADVVLLVDVYHHIPEREQQFFLEFRQTAR